MTLPKKRIRIRNRFAQALWEDKQYRPKKIISKKFKKEKRKIDVETATRRGEYE